MIELENVAYSYGGGELLSDISIRLAPLLIPVMAGGIALIATHIASRRALEALS